ncbi:hypothetical protein BDV93DRAFT_36890 [Ceratobasidium sp. AG-I]|nr:hypothetical protein BDV93DRAFT_36890 [Ceratobasidium sp. AG-I]
MMGGQTRPKLAPSVHQGESVDILVFCDGTGKNGWVDAEKTNVWWLYSLVGQIPTEKDKFGHYRRRKLLYIPGVGAEAKGIPKYLAQVFGKTIVEMVIKAYMFIAHNYREGDNVCIFGYSRGSFVARKVVGLLHRVGIVASEEDLLEQWKRREKPVPWESVKDTDKSVPVRCLGVWDTVGAIYSSPDCEDKDLLGIPDAELSPNVELALHVVAFHENRKRFRVTLFEPNPKTTLKEVWFPGAHSDVGGGGEKPTHMPRISLIWMIGEMKTFMEIYDEKVKYPLLQTLELTDAFHDSPVWKRAVDKFETRIESKALKPTSKIHQTVRDLKQSIERPVKDAKHSIGRQVKQHLLLTFQDLMAIHWNVQACLVACNTLEVMKQSRALDKAKQKEHTLQSRQRMLSLPNPPRLEPLTIPGSFTDVFMESPVATSATEFEPIVRTQTKRRGFSTPGNFFR